MEKRETQVKISVRNLVEFILRGGDIDTGRGLGRDMEAMQQGAKLHRKIQRSMGSGYRAEVPLSVHIPEKGFSLCVEGRADGIFEKDGLTVVDEIKGMYADVERFSEPVAVHRYQAMCYACIYGEQKKRDRMGVRLTYCNLETESVRYFEETLSMEELSQWFEELTGEYAKWALWQNDWSRARNASIRELAFPFPYRKGQKKLAADVYKTILREKRLYIEAPTGVGKTISTVFPAIKAMGEGLTGKIFYLTAKTIARTAAEEAFEILKEQGLFIKVVTVTAKEKVCILEKPECTPAACGRAKGHYDRINEAVFDMLCHEDGMDRERILAYAKKHVVCPFEMCLDLTDWADAVICDYNYAFDPNVYLRRHFADERKRDYVFLVDEAHNLVERAREMYSAVLVKERFLEVNRLVKGRSRALSGRLSACNSDLLAMKKEGEELRELASIGDFALHLRRLAVEYEEFLREFAGFEGREEALSLYFDVRHFLAVYEGMDERYVMNTGRTEDGKFRIKLQCMDPSRSLDGCLSRGRSAVFFSATLLPIQYYREQLAGREEDYAVYAPSPFDPEKRLILAARDVSTLYSRRSRSEYERIAAYIGIFTKAKKGNYLVFFPSYQLLRDVSSCMEEKAFSAYFQEARILSQEAGMSETEKEAFLCAFHKEPERTHIGLCVMGGVFAEGIDLTEDRLIGAVIVGTGLPMVCPERDLFRRYFEAEGKDGFAYAYLYNGMNKVLQAGGRVIRTARDRGAVLLLDERFQREEYKALFPMEWFPFGTVTLKSVGEVLEQFWKNGKEQ